MENITQIDSLKELLESKNIKCFITETTQKCVLYANGFSIRYKNGTYNIINVRNNSVKRSIPSIEDVFIFITEGFYKIKKSDESQMLKIMSLRRFGTPKKIVMRISSVYPVAPHQNIKMKKLLIENPTKSNVWFSKRFIEMLREKDDMVTIAEARKEILSMLPKEVPLYYHIRIPASKEEMINNEISIRDFVLLNVMYEYPFMFYHMWCNRKSGVIISSEKKAAGINIASNMCFLRNVKRKVSKDFWKQMEPYKDYLYEKVIEILVNKELPRTEMSGRGKHVLREIAAFYNIKCIDYSKIDTLWMLSLTNYFRNGHTGKD